MGKLKYPQKAGSKYEAMRGGGRFQKRGTEW